MRTGSGPSSILIQRTSFTDKGYGYVRELQASGTQVVGVGSGIPQSVYAWGTLSDGERWDELQLASWIQANYLKIR